MHLKIVYWGPPSSGKSMNLKFVHANVPEVARGDLSTLQVGGDRGHLEFLPLDMGEMHGRHTRFHLYTVPGGAGSEADRVSVLSGLDGVVFVIDSRKDRFIDALMSFRELEIVAEELGVDLARLPFVWQYNKRDLPDAVPIPVLNTRLNPSARPHVEAVATTGHGVLSTLRAVAKQVIEGVQSSGAEGIQGPRNESRGDNR